MWKEYGTDGVAINSQYSLLRSALNAMCDRACISRRTKNDFAGTITQLRSHAKVSLR